MENVQQNEFDVIKFLFKHLHADIVRLVNSLRIYPEYIIEATDSLINRSI